MITVTEELTDFNNFDAWAGGKYTLDEIRAAGKIDELMELAEELWQDGASKTQINDWLWFDRDSIFSWLGMTEEYDEDPDSETEDEEEDLNDE